MKTGSLVLLLWLLVGAAAAYQRDYFQSDNPDCAAITTIGVTVAAGPLNYFGVNPKVKDCDVPVPQPST